MKDQAIEEVRARRRSLLRDKYDGSVEKMIAACIEWQIKHPGRTVTPKGHRTTRRAVA